MERKKYFTFKECADLLSLEDLKRLYTYIETDSPEKIEMLIKGWFQEWNNIRMPDLFYLKIPRPLQGPWNVFIILGKKL